MSEGALNSAAPFRFAFLSAFSVPRSEHPRPSDARSPIRNPLCAFEGVDSFPQASCGPLPQMSSSRLGSGSRRHTLRASMYRRQRTNQKKRSQTHVQQSHPHRPPRILKRVFCSVAPQYPNSGESNRLTSQNSCSWSGFLSRPIWRTPLACHHYAARAVPGHHREEPVPTLRTGIKSGQMFSGRTFFVSSAFRAPARFLASSKRTGKRSSRAFAVVDLLGSRRCSVCIVITTTMKARDARRETQHQQ